MCIDIDECLENPCKQEENCINNEGSFSCSRVLDDDLVSKDKHIEQTDITKNLRIVEANVTALNDTYFHSSLTSETVITSPTTNRDISQKRYVRRKCYKGFKWSRKQDKCKGNTKYQSLKHVISIYFHYFI